MTQLEAKWICGGVEYHVVTTKRESETDEQHRERFETELAAALRRHPKD